MPILEPFHPVIQALLATCFTWALTALGAALVFLRRVFSREVLDAMYGFAAGVMIAASFWSLLDPAIAMSEDQGLPGWFPALLGFLSGAAFLWAVDKILPHLHLYLPLEQAEGLSTTWRRTTLLVIAIALHNFPEGLAIGVAFGAISLHPEATLTNAVALAVGIGIQNFPEGAAVSMPLHKEGVSRFKSFYYGQLSAVVEPLGGVIGAGAVLLAEPILPYALSFAAGAMMFVVVEELIPESQRGGHTDIATLGTMLGFSIMMVLDVAFG
ncbi:MAG: ZIP family metal transporter [Calditrichaeota bacterium]|nr:MAG: ZIP family metal transporter [Calditrichota bacterium]